MIERDEDEAAFEKILEAAERIADMARSRPEDAARLLERSGYLRGLAEEIRRDWQRRIAAACTSAPGDDAAPLTAVRLVSNAI